MIETDIEWLTIVANRLHKRLPKRRVDRHELLSDGYIALAKLRHQYDAQTGIPFRGFALKRVLGAMIDGLRTRQRWQRRIKRNEAKKWASFEAPMDVPLDRLTRRGRLVIHLHYREGVELATVAGIFACSAARISQIHRDALQALRSTIEGTKPSHQRCSNDLAACSKIEASNGLAR